MTEPTYVLGGWQSDFAEKAGDEGISGLIGRAVDGAIADAEVDAQQIEVVHVGNFAAEVFCGQAQLGGMVISGRPELSGLPTSRHEAACAAGSVAVLSAMADIESGRYDVALVVGAEVLRNVPGQRAGELMACAAWAGREAVGEAFPWPHLFARVAKEYEDRYGLEHAALGRIAEINFANGRRNPLAQARDWDLGDDPFGEADATNPVVSGMLRKTDCGRITDGSAAVVLASRAFAEQWAGARGVDLDSIARITGWGHATGPMLLDEKLRASSGEPYVFPHLRKALTDAWRRAGVADARDLDAVEVHDCFSISEYVALDHLGLVEPGKAWQVVEDGTIELGGTLPVNPSGGLLSLGHPVGATGVRMVLDGHRQVTGAAGPYQVDGARRVGTLNIGGSFTTAVSFVVASGQPGPR